MVRISQRSRRGTILPLMALSLVALCSFIALAVDVGMILVARTQAQNAADVAAMTGARTLNGSASGNVTAATTNATNAATSNYILANKVQSSELNVQHGAYHYNSTTQTFSPEIPPVAPDNYNLTQATVTHAGSTAFARVFNMTSFSVQATAIAANRPRDVAIVLDYSGSMNNESDIWNCETYLGDLINTPNNTDSVFPQYGWYSTTFSPLATLQCTSTSSQVGMCNVTTSVMGVPALVDDFYQNSFGASSPIAAFNPAPATVTNTSPGGDVPLNAKSSGSAAKTWQDITGSSSTLFKGYANYNGKFYGYTQGPGYWGMTFFAWPPDPNPANDWRKLYFFLSDGETPLNDNTKAPLSGTSGSYPMPSGNYVINYKAILAWIQANCIQQTSSDNKPFPPQLRAGNILYYDQVPTDVPASAYDHTQLNSAITDPNQRFWKEYIDFVLGVWRDPTGTIQTVANPSCSIGGDFTCGTSTSGQYVQLTGPDGSQNTWVASVNGKTVPYINPTDNPKRPRHRFWFGPMTMVQYMSDTGLLPGTVHDISMYPAKLGIAGALLDIQNNHPNDLVSMILFSRPQYSNDPAGDGAFNLAQYSLSRDYASMINSLWYPPNASTSDVRPWDVNGLQTPRAHGDYDSNTATSYGFMLAYNQFSGSNTLSTQIESNQPVGGLGRKGAQRLVILETDGMANVDSVPVSGFYNGGVNNSYYQILPSDTVDSGDYSQDNLLQIVQAICNNADGTPGNAPGYANNPGYPGFSTSTKPVIVQTLAFGAIFEPAAAGNDPQQAAAVSLLQQISTIGGTVFPSSSSDPTNGFKWVIGTLSQRQTNLQKAFSAIMADGVAVVMVQ